MPNWPVIYEDVEILEVDGLGFTCRIGKDRIFIGKYVSTARTVFEKGDRGSLSLPRSSVEQQGLPLTAYPTDDEVEAWFTRARLGALWAREHVENHPGDDGAQAALDRARAQLSAAMQLRAKRLGAPRR